MACSEDHDLIILPSLLEALISKRPDVNSSLHSFSRWKSHRNRKIIRRVLNIVNAVNQRLVQVENYGFLMSTIRQCDLFLGQFFIDRLVDCLHILQRLERLNQVILMKILLFLFFGCIQRPLYFLNSGLKLIDILNRRIRHFGLRGVVYNWGRWVSLIWSLILILLFVGSKVPVLHKLREQSWDFIWRILIHILSLMLNFRILLNRVLSWKWGLLPLIQFLTSDKSLWKHIISFNIFIKVTDVLINSVIEQPRGPSSQIGLHGLSPRNIRLHLALNFLKDDLMAWMVVVGGVIDIRVSDLGLMESFW